ncbi:MAG: DUF2183 domain-containing protein [Bacteroidales bacterium]|nr:DUF2183 domain-containing protein [Bacteroidales bacterium]
MAKINVSFRKILRKTRWPWVKLSLYIKKKLGWLGVPVILPYIGFSNDQEIFLSGSVIEDRSLSKPKEGQGIWQNIVSMFRRYAGDEFAGVGVRVVFEDQTTIVETNEEGYFSCTLKLPDKFKNFTGWEQAYFYLEPPFGGDTEKKGVAGEVLIVALMPRFLIISDVDDTFLVSHSTQTFRKMRLLLFKNALTRLPFPGVAAFYRALQKGVEQSYLNPIFYVSSSELNLYDLLIDFVKFRNIPKGPFLLREMQTSFRKLIAAGGGDHMHKLHKISFLLNKFPDIPAILIGDSGQRDPEIYTEVVKTFRGRINAIYIRSIGKQKKRQRTEDLAANLAGMGVNMLLVEHTYDAALHAVSKGYMGKEYLDDIQRERSKDEPET